MYARDGGWRDLDGVEHGGLDGRRPGSGGTVKKTKKPKMGRPLLGEDAMSVVFTLRLTEKERDALVKSAEREGKPVTAWARETLLAATI